MAQFKATKVTQFLSLLSSEEMNQLGKWLASPWCNSNKKLIVLHKVLFRYHPEFDSKRLTKEWLFKRLYPDKKYDDKWMRNIMAAMTKQVEKFLVHQRLENDELEKRRFLGDALLERNDIKTFIKVSDALISNLNSKTEKTSSDFYLLYWLNNQRFGLPESVKNEASLRKVLMEAELNLDTFFALEKWRMRIVKAERQRLLGEKDFDFTDDFYLEHITKKMNSAVISSYQSLMALSKKELKVEYYFKAKEGVESIFEKLNPVDRSACFDFLFNYVVQLWKGGEKGMLEEMFNLYEKGLEEKLFLKYGLLPERIFSNYVTIGNSLGEKNRVLDFIEQYTVYLKKENQKGGRAWALAHCDFKDGNLFACMERLSTLTFKSHSFNMKGKVMLLQCYFELSLKDDSYFLPFLDLALSLEKFFRRDKVFEANAKLSFLNFIKISRKLLKCRMNGTVRGIEAAEIEKEISSNNNIQARNWLLEKAVFNGRAD